LDREGEIALRSNTSFRSRLTHLRRAAGGDSEGSKRPERWRLAPVAEGSLDEMQCVPSERRQLSKGEVEIAVEAAALNFKDVLNVLGLYPGDPGPLGGECAGIVSAVGRGVTGLRVGDPVMAIGGGSLASHVVTPAHLVQLRPGKMTAEEGASLSIAYLTAEYCLGHLAKLLPGQRVLIHAAAGGVGMAAMAIARRAGAEIFATAGAPWKRDLLREMGASRVYDSRNAGFAKHIMDATGGRGVDVVLNSLGGDLIEPSFAALARGGCFVEIGKRGIKSYPWVEALGRDLCYHVVDWGETAKQDPPLIARMYATLVQDIGAGKLAPLPCHVFALSRAGRAFRLMAQAGHAGKVIIRIANPRPWAPRRDGSYLVTGGLSGLGLRVAQWLADGGAGRLVLIGRRGVTPEAEILLDELRRSGTEVFVEALDVANEEGLQGLLRRLRDGGPPLRGVWHCAGVLADAMLAQQDEDQYARTLTPKILGSVLLDALTRQDALDCFVLFSSAASVLGSRGQSNHAAANAFLDVLAHQRAGRGLPALSINWGPWSEVGVAADRLITGRLAGKGIAAIAPEQGLSAMQELLQRDAAQAAVLPIDWDRYLARLGIDGIDSFFSGVAGELSSREVLAVTALSLVPGLRESLADQPVARRRPFIASFVRERALRALGIDQRKPVDPRAPLGDLGLDSLLAVELRNTLSNAIGHPLPASLLFDYPTLDSLTDHLLQLMESDGSLDVIETPDANLNATLVGSIEDLSDAEVDRLLELRKQLG
jgi:NADPH:quinone reductase-like Zn-dependent oxidoreductase/NAD(P)-dependent dehydrogenase (short-subunit alcohol dehydrogenase family)